MQVVGYVSTINTGNLSTKEEIKENDVGAFNDHVKLDGKCPEVYV